MRRIARRNGKPRASESCALQIERRHRQHCHRGLIETRQAHGGECGADCRRVARVDLDRHVIRGGGDDVVCSDDRGPANGGLRRDIDRQNPRHARNRDAADAGRSHDGQTEADILNRHSDPPGRSALRTSNCHSGEAPQAGATDLNREQIVSQTRHRNARDGLEKTGVRSGAECLPPRTEGK